ncbi:predicted transcriptional regulators [Lachnospiraceae bacterium KM106-2]|nr:predicted transcriptional regulators [Lachnospiraceae bacterium KM106-2]
MSSYVTGSVIKKLREEKKLTQRELSDAIGVSDKAISKWETGRGLPDSALLDPLAKALGVSIAELLTGECVKNNNVASNLLRSKFYVCPVCGNVIHTMGEGMISCCGITLPVLEGEAMDDDHTIQIERVENEHYITLHHPMTKSHYISFIAYVTSNKIEMVKLYPEGAAETRFLIRGHGLIYCYCNQHGLVQTRI